MEEAFQVLFNKGDIKVKKECLQNIISKFHIFLWKNDQIDEIALLSDNSKIIIIDEYHNDNFNYLFICFDYNLIIINQNCENKPDDSVISKFISNFKNSRKIYLKNTLFCTQNNSDNDIFLKEIKSFSNEFSISNDKFASFWMAAVDSLSGFLIKKSYDFNLKKSDDRNSFKKFNSNQEKIETTKMNYIKLREIGQGSSCTVDLIYCIEKEEIFALKIPKEGKDDLIERERVNYSKIECPYTVQYYGYIEIDGKKCLILEYVEGRTLSSYDLTQLNENEKIDIIFELILTIQYIHSQEFIYRDLHFDNVFINDNKDAILIDFDRLININDKSNKKFSEPELSDQMNFSSDVLMLGYMIYYILNGEKPKINVVFQPENNGMKYEFLNLESKPEEKSFFESYFQPNKIDNITVNTLIHPFYVNFMSKNQTKGKKEQNLINCLESNSLKINQNDCFYALGVIYYEGKFVPRDVDKAIHFYSLAADLNDAKAALDLGNIYNEGKFVTRDVEKAKHYFSLAENQNK